MEKTDWEKFWEWLLEETYCASSMTGEYDWEGGLLDGWLKEKLEIWKKYYNT